MPGSTPGTGTRQRTRGGPSRAPGNNKERWLKVPIMDEAVDQLTLIIIGCTFDLPESGGDIRNLVFGARAAEKMRLAMEVQRAERRLQLEQSRRHCKSQLSAYQEFWDKKGRPDGPNILLGYDGLVLDLDKL